jgi:uncharacterized protein YegP (UPF0339 family)
MPERAYPCFYRYRDDGGQYYWLYFARNGEPIARSSESYASAADCDHSIVVMKACAPARYFTED